MRSVRRYLRVVLIGVMIFLMSADLALACRWRRCRPHCCRRACVTVRCTPALCRTPEPRCGSPKAAPAETGGLKVELTDLQDEAPVGRNVVCEVRITNTRKVSDFEVVLSMIVPLGMTPLSARPMGATNPTVTGQHIRFGAVEEIRPNEVLIYRVPVRPNRTGRVRLEVNVTSRTEARPIAASEEINVHDEN